MTAWPDVKKVPLNSEVQFILLACDGLWDMKTSKQAIDQVHREIYENQFGKKKVNIMKLKNGLEDLVDTCCIKNIHETEGKGCDNITAVLVEFVR